jgi:hypothetical protein
MTPDVYLYLMFILTILGTILLMKKKRWGFALFSWAGIVLVIYYIVTLQYIFVVLVIISIILNVIGFLSWKHKVLAIKCTECSEYIPISTLEEARRIGQLLDNSKTPKREPPVFVCKKCFKPQKHNSYGSTTSGFVVFHKNPDVNFTLTTSTPVEKKNE